MAIADHWKHRDTAIFVVDTFEKLPCSFQKRDSNCTSTEANVQVKRDAIMVET